MFGLPAEFKNVRLSDAEVLEKPPRRERQIFQARSPQPFGQTFDGLAEISVSPPATQQFNQMFPESGLRGRPFRWRLFGGASFCFRFSAKFCLHFTASMAGKLYPYISSTTLLAVRDGDE